MYVEKEIEIFCKNIKCLRVGRRLSQKEMAKKLGIDVKRLSMIERGFIPQDLDVTILFQIHRIFGVLPSDMFLPFS